MTAPLHVALAFDDRFWAPAYATIRSVCISTTRRSDLVFHLFSWKLDPVHAADFDAIAEEFGATVILRALEDEPGLQRLIESLPHTKSFPPVVYARLLLDELLPPTVERVLYLDSDLYVRAPVEQLLEMDLADKTLAAAPEPGRHHLIRGDDMRSRKSPFDSADPYFNSGVLLINRRAWGRAGLATFLTDLQQSGELKALYHDQDVLNLRFRGDWLRLDPLWNLTKPHPALRALDPFIVHYTTGMKPWNRLAYVAFGSSYKHVMTRDLLRRYRRYRLKLWLAGLTGRKP
ncbi:MAG TPA: glycosyltransferase family 8 protein [Devosiaceae bacterium]|nr:glycosyltransferase family 8 protein [Devosiaceae bacterium]